MATQCTSDAFPLAGLGRRHVVAKFDLVNRWTALPP